MGEWREALLGDVIELKRGYDLPKHSRVEGIVPLVSSSGISGHIKEAKVQGPGVVTGRYGTIGQVAYVDEPFWPLNTTLYVRDFKGNDPRFISYFLTQLDFLAYSDKAAVPGINRNHLHQASVRLPSDIEEQAAIASVLSALDDKIDLNRRMNETLEASARELFRDWFVDFGPVKAKMAGTTPYLAPDLWSLFPDRLDDEGLPEGWAEHPLDEVADFLNGLALQKFPAPNGAPSLPVIKISELRTGPTAKSNRASINVPDKYIIDDGDFLFSWSGSLLAKFWTHGRGALNQHLFKVTSTNYPAWFYSHWVWHHLAQFQMIAASKATTMGHIQRGHLKAATCVVPSDELLAKLSTIIEPIVDRTITNKLENRTLAQTRDMLLPKLMAGEVEVDNVAKELEKA